MLNNDVFTQNAFIRLEQKRFYDITILPVRCRPT